MNGKAATFDLIVIGAGIIGASCADVASAEGMRVAIVEPGPVGGGATAAAMGHLVAMDDDPAELALAHYSLRLWEDFAELKEAEFSRCGTLWVARNDQELGAARERIARLKAVGIDASLLDAATLYELEPALVPGLAGGMLVPREAVVYPPRMANVLVNRALSRGARLYAGRRAQSLPRGGVQLDDGTHLSGPVLVATGCALPTLLPALAMRARKGHLVITDRYPGFIRHQLLELGYADSAHGDADSSVAFNVQPRPTGQILIGSSREFSANDADVSPAMVQRMLARSFAFVPALRQLQALRIWTGFRPTTPDGRPYLGAVPDAVDQWVAAGHEGLGVTTALGSATLMIDLIQGRRPAIDPTPYSPSRMAA
ncbi:NAD(P)/FAD-dependent oxidoreductase [Dyella japonica]|uniref:D-amino acid oxidase n=1 Tax=Dyella japonica A8 TaxID=1217721 RepID=A0A075K5V1_9GAMM|nr:FAD-dependent oxidoreductase [Dyella japonica]AIF47553.1 D-amino acid oxidase [Dyella japonica A8]